MRLLSKVALGGSVASAATVGALVAAGVFATSATLVAVDPVAPPAQADALTPFDSCGDLLDWYVDRGVREVGEYGWNYPYYGWGDVGTPRMAFDAVGAGPQSAALSTVSKSVARSSSATGTNTQEEAVDEPDIAKTNGSLVARIVADRRLVLFDVTGAEPTVTRRLQLPRDGYGAELLLVGDRVLITQQAYGRGPRALTDSYAMKFPGYTRGNGTRILEVDISDPAAPKVVRTDLYSGDLVSLRQYGDTVRLVTSTQRPNLKWTYPKKGVTRREAIQRNRALVRATTIEDWLPSAKNAGRKKALLDCDQVFHPQKWSGPETVAVTTYAVDEPAAATSVAVTASGQVVYSSADRLYVASTEYGDRFDDPMAGDLRRSDRVAPTRVRTDLHSFALDGARTTYVASGHLNGSVRDRWSLDEYDGRLRVAWSTMDRKGGTRNGISVFTEKDDRLEQTGFLDGLGPNEDIQSVRWLDDLAIVVTFRQIDPLYTIDLTDQDAPRRLGALKIPGYSGYLHPIGGNLLLGLGVDADRKGNTRGAQAAVFDISDLTDPKRISQVTFGRDTWINALDDPRAFTWLAENRTGATPVADWRNNRNRLVGFDVSPTGQLRTRTLAPLNQDYQARTLDLGNGRLAVLDAYRLRVVKVG
ncbi:hypothetical protein EFK50_16860 [Nocardioides marmoriginsengisoli]|uniref:Benzoate transporter n=1 Tax=Nocardioides marmoriginsengisoli TaxID=661483 RepID=A0A3N0CC92_9ACTN|nr:beta-propeller domain-containing protein [Nocardioides marmoriginsengisoli]RNL61054.1 hypothetical protein EFK50_16860 [Nocardioides marmoriginsengisoli]